MFKKESIYNNDGELVTMRTMEYKGHFNDDRGYVAYYKGKMVRLSKYLQPDANYIGYKGNKVISPMDAMRIGEVIGVGES